MLNLMAAHEQSKGASSAVERPVDAGPDTDAGVVGELLGIVPRWVDRTRSQAEIARKVVAMVPCIGALVPGRHDQPGPGVPEHERVDVLSVLRQDPESLLDAADPQSTEPAGDIPAPTAGAAHSATEPVMAAPAPAPIDEAAGDQVATGPTPTEADLPIQDYDSLAASQVVPRLATLAPDDLVVVQRYEGANRRRQTILNRVAQLLGG